MNITDVRVRKVKDEKGGLKAIASLTIDNAFAVHDIKVVKGNKGLFILMPSRKASNLEVKYMDVVHPTNQETREMLQNIILEKYEEVIAKGE